MERLLTLPALCLICEIQHPLRWCRSGVSTDDCLLDSNKLWQKVKEKLHPQFSRSALLSSSCLNVQHTHQLTNTSKTTTTTIFSKCWGNETLFNHSRIRSTGSSMLMTYVFFLYQHEDYTQAWQSFSSNNIKYWDYLRYCWQFHSPNVGFLWWDKVRRCDLCCLEMSISVKV